MKKLLLIFGFLTALQLQAQKYMTKTGSVSFTSKAPMETIVGNNRSVACLLDAQTGSLDFVVTIKSFVFDKQLMQEHFNETYMESDKYPKATYKGQILNMNQVNLSKDGEYEVHTAGKLSIHNVTRDVKQSGKLIVRGGKIILQAGFSVLLSDYNIAIPGAVKDKISRDVKVQLNCALDKK